jgi:hypothetical protein
MGRQSEVKGLMSEKKLMNNGGESVRSVCERE